MPSRARVTWRTQAPQDMPAIRSERVSVVNEVGVSVFMSMLTQPGGRHYTLEESTSNCGGTPRERECPAGTHPPAY